MTMKKVEMLYCCLRETMVRMSSVDIVAGGAFKIKRMYDVANNCEVCQSK